MAAFEDKMKIHSVDIAGFRGISELSLDFPERINVLAGINGAGKSAVLDCIAILLSRLIGRIRSSTGTGRFFSESDINNDFAVHETQNSISIKFQGETIQWRVTKGRKGRRRQRIKGLDELRWHVEQLRFRLEDNEDAALPLAVYYPVNRAVLDIPLRIKRKHRFDRLAAYDQALSGSPSSFRIFFEWFRQREDLENERRLEKSKFRDPQLQAVRTATERLIPGFKNLKVRRSPLRMVVEKNEEELTVNQLSDGEKCTLAMVGDLARRMAIANPHMRDPLVSEAVVLIDEIDLHLHPAWQRLLASTLEKTFPNCQFLLSTHSPAILSHLDPSSIWMLERTNRGIEAKRPSQAYGQTVDRVLEDIMNVPARPVEIRRKLAKLFLVIEQGNLQKAEHILRELKGKIGTDPDLVKAGLLIRRKELAEE